MNRDTYFVALVLCFVLISGFEISGARSVGVCYGRIGNNLPPQAEVVTLYKAKNIPKMRIYDPDPATLRALRGSNIELILDVPNDKLQELATSASAWIRTNVVAYPDVNFKYIAVGNEVDPPNAHVLQAMRNVQKEINLAKLGGKIKVSTAISFRLLKDSYPPSKGSFTESAQSYMGPIITFLMNNGSPLLANIYPYFAYIGDPTHIPLPYALFTSPGTVVTDPIGQYQYQNLFDAMLDAVYVALEKLGGSRIQIVVSESGWPSAGHPAATLDNAAKYYRNLINHVGKGIGTPRKRRQAIHTYLFAMFDENQKRDAETEKHFGVFYPDKQPKYQLTFG